MKTYDCIQCGKTTKWGHSKRNKFCGFTCQQEYNYRERVSLLIEGKAKWGIQTPPWAKRYIKELKGERCEVCGLTEWLGNPITLELDHTDGNPKNNTVEKYKFDLQCIKV